MSLQSQIPVVLLFLLGTLLIPACGPTQALISRILFLPHVSSSITSAVLIYGLFTLGFQYF